MSTRVNVIVAIKIVMGADRQRDRCDQDRRGMDWHSVVWTDLVWLVHASNQGVPYIDTYLLT